MLATKFCSPGQNFVTIAHLVIKLSGEEGWQIAQGESMVFIFAWKFKSSKFEYESGLITLGDYFDFKMLPTKALFTCTKIFRTLLRKLGCSFILFLTKKIRTCNYPYEICTQRLANIRISLQRMGYEQKKLFARNTS